MKYQKAIQREMGLLAKDPRIIFLGEGIINAGRVYGTLDDVPLDQCREMPIAENLIMGVAMGLCLEGFRPIMIFQRMDFMLVCADAIINHLALMPKMSGGQFAFPLIIRAIIGEQNGKFEMGPQHNKDLSYIFMPYVQTLRFTGAEYSQHKWEGPVIITEQKGEYETDIIA